MVVGSGQSGAQIAEDLLINGMDVSLALSKCGRRLRKYRGKDSSWWNYKMGLFDKTVDDGFNISSINLLIFDLVSLAERMVILSTKFLNSLTLPGQSYVKKLSLFKSIFGFGTPLISANLFLK